MCLIMTIPDPEKLWSHHATFCARLLVCVHRTGLLGERNVLAVAEHAGTCDGEFGDTA